LVDFKTTWTVRFAAYRIDRGDDDIKPVYNRTTDQIEVLAEDIDEALLYSKEYVQEYCNINDKDIYEILSVSKGKEVLIPNNLTRRGNPKGVLSKHPDVLFYDESVWGNDRPDQ
jgi:hypothetical protein